MENWIDRSGISKWISTQLAGKTIKGARLMTLQEYQAAGMGGVAPFAPIVFECSDGTIFFAMDHLRPYPASLIIWTQGGDSRHDPKSIPPQGDA